MPQNVANLFWAAVQFQQPLSPRMLNRLAAAAHNKIQGASPITIAGLLSSYSKMEGVTGKEPLFLSSIEEVSISICPKPRPLYLSLFPCKFNPCLLTCSLAYLPAYLPEEDKIHRHSMGTTRSNSASSSNCIKTGRLFLQSMMCEAVHFSVYLLDRWTRSWGSAMLRQSPT